MGDPARNNRINLQPTPDEDLRFHFIHHPLSGL